jgi:pimeloyl-ACP methyl ester carboxylesterase
MDARDVDIPTEDGFTLRGTLHPGATPDAPAVVLVHQVGSARAEWATLVRALREEPALTVLTFDLRGHGESTRGPRGEVSFGGFDTDAWSATSADVAAAVGYLGSPACPVHPRRIGLVGASIGATAAIRSAVGDRNLDPIVLLSPGRAYRGVDGILVATDLGPRSVLAVSARDEADSVETGAALARITHGRARVVDGAAHGVALFAADETLLEAVTSFVREGLARPPGTPAEAGADGTPPEGAPGAPSPSPAAPADLPQ